MKRERRLKQRGAAVLGRYRKLFVRLWRHPDFRKLKPGARELVLYLLTGPQTSSIGLFYFSHATAAEDLGVGVDELLERLTDVTTTFGWLHDSAVRVVYIPSWWRWNQPENGNVLVHVLKALADVPPCALAEGFARNLTHLDARFHDDFVAVCTQRIGQGVGQRIGQPARNQEQEQEPRSGALNMGRSTSRAPQAKPDTTPAKNGSDEGLIRFARQVFDNVKASDAPLDYLVDVFYQVAPNEKAPRPDVVAALTQARAELTANIAKDRPGPTPWDPRRAHST